MNSNSALTCIQFTMQITGLFSILNRNEITKNPYEMLNSLVYFMSCNLGRLYNCLRNIFQNLTFLK